MAPMPVDRNVDAVSLPALLSYPPHTASSVSFQFQCRHAQSNTPRQSVHITFVTANSCTHVLPHREGQYRFSSRSLSIQVVISPPRSDMHKDQVLLSVWPSM